MRSRVDSLLVPEVVTDAAMEQIGRLSGKLSNNGHNNEMGESWRNGCCSDENMSQGSYVLSRQFD